MKTYEVKVYSKDDEYITTWKDIVSDISFYNEINSAGGEMTLTLGRNAGDYGEGSDVDFGLKVVVYCIDKDAPDGTIIFQGYISSYTPIYADDNVRVTIMGYGAELNDYMIESGASDDFSMTSGNLGVSVGTTTQYYYMYAAQTITATSPSGSWSGIALDLRTDNYYDVPTSTWIYYTNIPVVVKVYTGNVVGSGTLLGTSSTVTILDETQAWYTFTFPTPIPYTAGSLYYFTIEPQILGSGSNVNATLVVYSGSGSSYTGGAGYVFTNQ